MTFKGKISSWFMRNLIKPRMEKMDAPGYVVAKIGGKSKLREVILPEKLLSGIEDKLEDEFGQKGAELLYSAGKDWGWRYAMVSHFPQAKESSNSKFKGFMDLFVRYIESVYAETIDYELDAETDSFELETRDYIVCRKNGKGYLLSTGVWAGFIGHLYSNPSVEASKLKCEGRGDEICQTHFGPVEKLDSPDFNVGISEEELSLHKKYSKINQVREVKYAKNSMKDLLKKGFFEYTEEGTIKYEGERFVITETSLLFLLERKLDELEGGEDIVFNVAFDVGKELGEDESLSFISDYLPALGWGDVKPVKGGKKVQVFSTPWTRFAEEIEFVIFRGLVSGMVSGIKEDEIRFEDYEENMSKTGYNLVLKS